MQPLEVSPNGLKFTLGLPIKVFLLITYQEKLLLNPDGNTPPPDIFRNHPHPHEASTRRLLPKENK